MTPALAVLMILAAGGAGAQDSGAPSEGSGLRWHAFVAASYTQAFEGSSDGALNLYLFDNQAGTPRLDIASVGLSTPAAPLGFRIDLVSGKSVPTFASFGAWKPAWADVKQVFVTAKLGAAEVQIGKFVTSAGFEVIEDWDNPNPNISHSFLFGYAIPFAHTGVRVSQPLGGGVSVMAGMNRGWDKWRDDNGAMSWEGALFVSRDRINVTFDTHHGPEQAGNARDWRHLYDISASGRLSSRFSVAVNADYGTESGAAPGGDVRWSGLAVYGIWKFASGSSMALRLEEFRDPQGSRTGTPQTLRDADLTLNWKLRSRVLLRLNGRVDRSDSAIFRGRSDQLKTSRRTVACVIHIWR